MSKFASAEAATGGGMSKMSYGLNAMKGSKLSGLHAHEQELKEVKIFKEGGNKHHLSTVEHDLHVDSGHKKKPHERPSDFDLEAELERLE
jgi:hypothetical protein